MNGLTTTKVRDLGLAAALVSHGHEIRGTNRDTSGRAYFIFVQTTGLSRDINAYWANSLNVKARTFFDNTKMLKSRIYAEE